MQTATKNIIKTAQININDNKNVEATRRLKYQRKALKSVDAVSCCNKGNNICSNVWPINDENNNKNKNKKKIINKQQSLLLLITMTVLMTILQMPNSTTAATIVRVKDARQQFTHHSSGGSSSESDSDSDADDKSDSSSIDDIVEIILNKGDEHDLKRTRKTKRHSGDLYLLHHQHESQTDLEWLNPCNGEHLGPIVDRSENPPQSYFLTQLRKLLSHEFHNVNDSMHVINTSDLKVWSKYNEYYSFLPKVKLNSNIALKRWYRQIQTYVGAFAYLGRTQLKWDHDKIKSTSDITDELDQLLTSARSILCEIETAINGSYPYPSNKPKLSTISRDDMNNKLRFLTKHHANQENNIIEPQMLDIQFTKAKYFQILRRMWRVIRIKTKRNGQKSISLGLSNESSVLSASSSISEDSIGGDYSASKSQSSFSESFETSLENKSKRQRRPRHQRKQRKSTRKSAELPKF